MNYKLAYIEWEDAYSDSRWLEDSEIDEFAHKRMVCYQVGWIIREDKTSIVMSAAHRPEDSVLSNQWGNVIKIPKTWIRKRKIIQL